MTREVDIPKYLDSEKMKFESLERGDVFRFNTNKHERIFVKINSTSYVEIDDESCVICNGEYMTNELVRLVSNPSYN